MALLMTLFGATACGGGGQCHSAGPSCGDDGYCYDDPYEGPYDDYYDYGYPRVEVEFISGTTSVLFPTEVPGDGDVAEFTVTYRFVAHNVDVYVDATCTGGGMALLPEDGNVFEISEDVLVFTDLSVDGDSIGDSFLVERGTAVEFTLTVIAEARGDGFAQLILEGIGWSTSPGEGDRMFVLPEGEFATMPVFMNYN
jgi:hypothetical protein